MHAVRGVSFVLREGDTLGLIGSNGSGKSTLLSALTGLLPLEQGRIHVRSRPTLLGVGAVLRPALSGRRNIVLGLLAVGLNAREAHERVDDVIDFSGIRESIDLPMKTYSSGMRARLTFAIATAVTPDILLIDEALAVGDEQFRKRSRERIDDVLAGAGALDSRHPQPGRDQRPRAIVRSGWRRASSAPRVGLTTSSRPTSKARSRPVVDVRPTTDDRRHEVGAIAPPVVVLRHPLVAASAHVVAKSG